MEMVFRWRTPIKGDGSVFLRLGNLDIIDFEGLKIHTVVEINIDLSNCWATSCTLVGRWHTWKSVRSWESKSLSWFALSALTAFFRLSMSLSRDTETVKVEEVPSMRHKRITSGGAIVTSGVGIVTSRAGVVIVMINCD